LLCNGEGVSPPLWGWNGQGYKKQPLVLRLSFLGIFGMIIIEFYFFGCEMC